MIKSSFVGVLIVVLFSVGGTVWYEHLRYPLYEVHVLNIPYETYDVVTGACVNCDEVGGRDRYAQVPWWSMALDQFFEFGTLAMLLLQLVAGFVHLSCQITRFDWRRLLLFAVLFGFGWIALGKHIVAALA